MDVPNDNDNNVTRNIMANVKPPLLRQTKSSSSIAPKKNYLKIRLKFKFVKLYHLRLLCFDINS